MQFSKKLRYGGWVSCSLLALWGMLLPDLTAQTLDSRFGSAHTPRGHLHLLVVFVNYAPGNPTNTPNWLTWPNTSALPTFAQDSTTIPGMNQLLTADTTTLLANLGYQNISQYYYRMSDGKGHGMPWIYGRWVCAAGAGGVNR